MSENMDHIISRFRWDTSFDQQERATELQQRLSALSNVKLQREIAEVFDKLCPPEQTWRIQSLELDLGLVEMDNLEPDLIEKIRAQLYQKLIDLIIYINNSGHSNIEIFNSEESAIELLRSFLLHGVMPWSYKNNDGSVNRIMLEQLQTNPEVTIEMICDVSASSKEIRKRIAWQFHEPIIHKIIEGLEPTNHSQITDFSEELVKIQTNETIVQASVSDFKKSVWLWVLNYLLTERGTFFNKLNLMKSSIRQMADHYNIGYDKLFEMIEVAVERLSRTCTVKADFIATLQALSKEKRIHEKKIEQDLQTALPYQLKTQRSKERREIMNYLLAGSEQLMDSFIKEYTVLLRRELRQFTESKVVARLIEIYWQCLVNYRSHKGNKEAFRKNFTAAVVFNFPVVKSILSKQRSLYPATTKHQDQILKNGVSITKEDILLLIEQCFEQANTLITKNETKYSLEELLNIALEQYPKHLREVIIRLPEKNIHIVSESVPFTHFSAWIMSDDHGQAKASMDSIRSFHSMITHIVAGDLSKAIQLIFWKASWKLITTNYWQEADIKELVRTVFYELAKTSEIDAMDIISQMKKKRLRLPPVLKEALAVYLPAFAAPGAEELIATPHDTLLQCERKGLLDDVCYHIIVQKQLPPWLEAANDEQLKNLLNEIVIHHPVKFFSLIKQEVISEPQVFWLSRAINFTELVNSIGQLNKNRETILSIIERFHAALGNISIGGITGRELQYIVFQKLLKAWTTGNWKIIYTDSIWNELIWETCTKRGISKKDFLRDVAKTKHVLPPSLQLSFEKIRQQEFDNTINIPIPKSKIPRMQTQESATVKGGIHVTNAGLVLVNSYVPMLFERLNLIQDKKFIGEQQQLQAVHYLQFVATGHNDTEESYLCLNKLLCGLEMSQPVPGGIEISEQHRELIQGMLQAVIGHWPAIGSCSIDGFRGNWLIRNGLLSELDDKWELHVEKKAYDLLIDRSPYSFSIIRYPWMKKPLHVYWSY